MLSFFRLCFFVGSLLFYLLCVGLFNSNAHNTNYTRIHSKFDIVESVNRNEKKHRRRPKVCVDERLAAFANQNTEICFYFSSIFVFFSLTHSVRRWLFVESTNKILFFGVCSGCTFYFAVFNIIVLPHVHIHYLIVFVFRWFLLSFFFSSRKYFTFVLCVFAFVLSVRLCFFCSYLYRQIKQIHCFMLTHELFFPSLALKRNRVKIIVHTRNY